MNPMPTDAAYRQAYEQGRAIAPLFDEVSHEYPGQFDLRSSNPYRSPVLRYAWESGAQEALMEMQP